MSKTHAAEMGLALKIKETTTHYFHELVDLLYGTDARTQRTLGLCMLSMAFGFLLSTQAPMVCGL